MLILIVEDDPDHAVLITGCLRDSFGMDLKLEVAQSGEEALERLELCSPLDEPDIILLDNYLPGMSGMELLIRLREAHDTRPIVILTSCNDQQLALQALRYGASDFITKSAELSHNLTAAVARTLEHVRLHKELMAAQDHISALEVPELLVQPTGHQETHHNGPENANSRLQRLLRYIEDLDADQYTGSQAHQERD